jgi:uncharacterized membrane protein YjjB (DUF3815 family)
MDLLHLLHDTVCGALAAAGFGVLFDIGFSTLPWCAASGALALAVRTVVLSGGWSIEAASLVAALVVGLALQLLPSRMADARDALHVVGCIPMVPGGFATKAILGLFAITAQNYTATNETLITAIDNALRVMFTLGALGTGLAIPTLLLRGRRMR